MVLNNKILKIKIILSGDIKGFLIQPFCFIDASKLVGFRRQGRGLLDVVLDVELSQGFAMTQILPGHHLLLGFLFDLPPHFLFGKVRSTVPDNRVYFRECLFSESCLRTGEPR